MPLAPCRLEISDNTCKSGVMTVHCFAHLDQDASAALPQLNAELGGFTCIKDPHPLAVNMHGNLLTDKGQAFPV
jgi:hypothetical protein